jgi:hypothetical protein
MNLHSSFAELKRRNVLRAAAFYAEDRIYRAVNTREREPRG